MSVTEAALLRLQKIEATSEEVTLAGGVLVGTSDAMLMPPPTWIPTTGSVVAAGGGDEGAAPLDGKGRCPL